MKKTFTLVLAGLLVLSGCTQKVEEPEVIEFTETLETETFEESEDKVKVGISWAMDEKDAAEDEDIQAYVEAISVSGGEPVYMLQVTDRESALKALELVDCVVMAGGEDINPSMYGEEMNENCEEPYDERDTSDYWLLKTAMEENVPVLATCRGLQMLNVVCGGTLYQDLFTEYDTEINHRDPELEDFTYHTITVEKDTLLYTAMGADTESYEVNSWHHQGIKDLGEGLSVVAVGEDGMIEGVEYKDSKYVVGVQFHPEWHIVEDTLDCVPMFTALMEASK
ncbi:MAG: gamma-glutamyl-gamma-aminobutyrate hydrolase family protein [Erysipelotrichaceae bacterium]|nr:gamma-glutamyl-gamma-aminobutyrate hydrolase family protein [Erysipelotrichaceae bacterium]